MVDIITILSVGLFFYVELSFFKLVYYMLKLVSRNKRLNHQLILKETNFFLHKLFRCFFVSPSFPNKLKKRHNFQSRKFYQYSIKNKTLLFEQQRFPSHFYRYYLNWQSKLAFRSSFTKTRTICFLTGRSRSVYRSFHLSRLKLREFGAAGYFTGLSKASW